MKRIFLLCGMLALAACASNPAPSTAPIPRDQPTSCDDGGPCKDGEKPR